jgi:hypothetical protein
VRDARPRSALPVEPNPIDELNTKPPRAAEPQQRDAGEMHYESLEQEITSLLGRPIGKNSQKQKTDQSSADNTVSDYDAGGDAFPEWEAADQPSSHSAVSSPNAVLGARPRLAPPVELDPLEFGTTTRAVESWRPNSGEKTYDSFEQEITSLLGRSTGKNSRTKKADQLTGRNADAAYDAVRDALSEAEEVDQPSRHNRPSTADEALGDAPREWAQADQPGDRDSASAYDAVRDALSEAEEVDQPGRPNSAFTADEALGDALRERAQADRPGGRDSASAYDAVRDALDEAEGVDQPSRAYRASTADEALGDVLNKWVQADQRRRYKRPY